jgi:hypothetical protein
MSYGMSLLFSVLKYLHFFECFVLKYPYRLTLIRKYTHGFEFFVLEYPY